MDTNHQRYASNSIASIRPLDTYHSKICMRQREFGGLKLERQDLKRIFSGGGYVSDSDASSLSRWVFL